VSCESAIQISNTRGSAAMYVIQAAVKFRID